jgi:hypothetical protein
LSSPEFWLYVVIWVLHATLFILFIRWVIYLLDEWRSGGNGITKSLISFLIFYPIFTEFWSIHITSKRLINALSGELDLSITVDISALVFRAVQLGISLGVAIWVERRFRASGKKSVDDQDFSPEN